MKFKISPFIVMVMAMLALSACLSQPHPNSNRFALEVRPPETQVTNNTRRTLLVGTVSAASGFDNRGLVYRIGPDQFDTDFYNEFMAPPARLLADQATNFLDAANRRVRVVRSPGLILADFGLETHLEAMYGDFTVSPPQAVIALRFTASDLRSSPARILLDKTYRHQTPLTGKSPAAVVVGLNGSLEAILRELNSDLERAIP